MRGFRRDASRDENVAAMFRAGMTMAQIGERYGLTRERARQILKAIGLVGKDGGAARSGREKAISKTRDLDLRHLTKYGVDFATYKELQANGATLRYREQQRSANTRAIPWRLTMGQWWQIWQESGKWDQRGRGVGMYCLARFGDRGAYELGNVWVCEFGENCREARGRAVRGARNVHKLYPGTKLPWRAKHGRVLIGRFATEAEAKDAKAKYLAEFGIGAKIRGWTFIAKNKSRPYLAQIERNGAKLKKSFPTAGEAEDACRQFVWKQTGRMRAAIDLTDRVHGAAA